MNWLLPEYCADALPHEAARIETLRGVLLELLRTHGYERVMPPLLGYLDSLLTGSGRDLRLRTFKLVDQFSGRTLGVRADITPQVARIDAHLLNRKGTARLCYCESVLHTLPATINATREPIQFGAELYGYAGFEADLEIIRLMAAVLDTAGLPAARIDLGHVGIFSALAQAAGLDRDAVDDALSLMQAKDVPGLEIFCAGIAEPYGSALRFLPELYGDRGILDLARERLPKLDAIDAALTTLCRLAAALPELPLSFDLSDLRGYHYHNGVVFAAYHPGAPCAVALGGRYDGVGSTFGRNRAATGFSLDLRELARLLGPLVPPGAIRAPYCVPGAENAAELAQTIQALRTSGEVVVEFLPGEEEGEKGGNGANATNGADGEGPVFDRRLVWRESRWTVAAR